MAGILDFITGSGQYEDPTAISPTYGVPQSDVRQALLNSLMSSGAALLAAGQPVSPAQRAQLIGQAGAAFGTINTDILNAAQRRLMTQQYEAKRAQAVSDKQLLEAAQDPVGFRARYGFDPSGLDAPTIRSIMARQREEAALNPDAQEKRRLELDALRRAAAQPKTMEAGGRIYTLNEQTGQWIPQTERQPTGGLEGEANAIILRGQTDPAVRASPAYSMAYNRMFAPRIEVRNGELVTIVPAAPPGILPPTAGVAQPPAAPAGAQPGTVTQVPGGGTVTQTPIGQRRLTPAEMQMRQETEDAIAATSGARSALTEALRLSREAYAGPAAAQRGAVAALLPGQNRAAIATREFGSLMTEQALGQLRTIFGGNPTEGERKILLDMQASVSMTQPERDALIARALEAVERRLPALQGRLEQITGGTYGLVAPQGQAPATGAQPAADAARINRLLRTGDLDTLRQIDRNSLTDEQKQLLLQRLRELGAP